MKGQSQQGHGLKIVIADYFMWSKDIQIITFKIEHNQIQCWVDAHK